MLQIIKDKTQYTPKDKIENSKVLILKYKRIYELNQKCAVKRKPGSGNHNVVSPSGTNRSRSRQPRATISGRRLRVCNVPNAVGGRSAYHFPDINKRFSLNKKERYLMHRSILIERFLKTVYVIDYESLKIKSIKQLKEIVKLNNIVLPDCRKSLLLLTYDNIHPYMKNHPSIYCCCLQDLNFYYVLPMYKEKTITIMDDRMYSTLIKRYNINLQIYNGV